MVSHSSRNSAHQPLGSQPLAASGWTVKQDAAPRAQTKAGETVPRGVLVLNPSKFQLDRRRQYHLMPQFSVQNVMHQRCGIPEARRQGREAGYSGDFRTRPI